MCSPERRKKEEMKDKTQKELIDQYTILFDAIDETVKRVSEEHDISPGVASVVMVRMSAMLAKMTGGVNEDDFVDFSRNHYQMAMITVDDYLKEQEEGLN